MATKRGTGATAPNGAQYVIQVDETGTIISGGVLGTVSITGTVIPTGAASTDKSIASATALRRPSSQRTPAVNKCSSRTLMSLTGGSILVVVPLRPTPLAAIN